MSEGGDDRAVLSPFEHARESAWKEAICALRPRLRGYVAKSGCSVDDIDDVVSEVLGELVVCEAAFFQGPARWEFVLPIVRRCCARAKRYARHELPAIGQAIESPDMNASEERERYLQLVAQWAHNILERLPPKQRTALRLHILEERSYSDIANIMNSSAVAVRFNVHAGLQRLLEIADHCPPPSDSDF